MADFELPTSILTDPFKMLRVCWPHITLFDDQAKIIESVHRGNKLTLVPAGNMLGKDFISAFIALHFFCSRSPVRVVTSSVDNSQLEGVLWGEVRRWIDSSKYPLGLKVNHLHLKQKRSDGSVEPLSEMIGRVAKTGVPEGLLGRHVARGPNGQPRALGVIDEASGFEDIHKDAMETWAHQILVIGNCYPCSNFFREGVRIGDLEDPHNPGQYYRKVIKIPAMRSPNVRLGLAEIAAGKKPSNREIIPGCLSYQEYAYRRATWDIQRQTVGLDAEFYEGEEVRLFPDPWLARAQKIDRLLSNAIDRCTGIAMGVDRAEGGDNTTWTVIDHYGVLEQVSRKTKDTAKINKITVSLMDAWGVEPQNVIFDLGSGGKVHVDYLNEEGYPVRGLWFGSTVTPDPRSKAAYEKQEGGAAGPGVTAKGAYKNRRVELYGLLRNRMNPNIMTPATKTLEIDGVVQPVFGIPSECADVFKQLSVLPLLYDAEGIQYLPPKDKPNPNYKGPTIKAMLGGRSPDEADSLALANYGAVYPVSSSVMSVF